MTIENNLENVQKTYTLLDEDASDTRTTKIRLDVDKYKGIVYHYGTVKLSPPNPDDILNVKFDYYIDTMPRGKEVGEDIESQKDFETLLGDILVSIIISKENEIRDNDTNTST